ncbi:hypothetical protein AB0K60_32900 [Thermopolyspora sp. NPDC052614]|uniref:hypothetical protein n=1 Tax=Thermopolyspora sp. NPDC052614 TaxID=3155682 RepID=UPI00343937AC
MTGVAVPQVPALVAALWLRHHLEAHGIAADVNGGYGLAVVSVCADLLVWTDGDRFWWRTRWNPRRRRYSLAWHPAADSERAARRIAFRLAQLRRSPSACASMSRGAGQAGRDAG